METLFKESYTEIVFDKRNKQFGAYHLRKRYAKIVLIAFLFSMVLFSLALSSPLIYSYFEKAEEVETKQVVVAEMLNVEEIEQPKEEIKKIEPPKESIKFPPLEIQPDDKVKEEEEVASEDDLKKSNPGSETHQGEKGHGSDPASNPKDPEPTPEPVKVSDENVYDWVESAAEYPGGELEMKKYIVNKAGYPEEAYKNNIQGTVFIEFIINKDGTPSDFKIIRSSGNALLDGAALAAVKTLPKFKPASMNGEFKKVRQKVRIPFILK